MKQRIDERRPLSKDEAHELDEYFKIGLTYSSNALEGNSLDLTETKVLLEDGITAGGKPIRDSYEATGHAEAYDFMLSIARTQPLSITEDVIKKLHQLFYNRIDAAKAGEYRDYQVIITGTDYLPPTADAVPALMSEFVVELNAKVSVLHPVLLAAFAHRRLVDIHPFADGNGRTARLLMNLILINKGYFIVSIPPVLRHDYIQSLRAAQSADNPDDTLFNDLIAECELETERDYCRLFNIPLETPPEHEH
jgi:Fic family protein